MALSYINIRLKRLTIAFTQKNSFFAYANSISR